MAQVVDFYSGVVQGDSTIYYYERPDDTSKPTRIYAGTGVSLPDNYASRITNSMYPTRNPGGWMFWWNIGDITPVYKTVTDMCTPPSAVTLNAQAKTLSITGGGGGDLNSFVGFGVSWRDRGVNESAWGAWSEDSVYATRVVNVTVPAGKVREFRVRTRGSAGSGYFSGYVLCPTPLNGNQAPGDPVVTLPQTGAATYCATPVAVVSCPAEPDGDAQILLRSIDGGAWTEAASVAGTGGTVYDRLPALAQGAHTVAYSLRDGYGSVSGTATVSLTVKARIWARVIAPGTVIANAAVSHRADIAELLETVNALGAYYGLAVFTLPGTVGAFADWKPQMAALQAVVAAAETAAGQAARAWTEAPAYPAAAVVNELRARAVEQ